MSLPPKPAHLKNIDVTVPVENAAERVATLESNVQAGKDAAAVIEIAGEQPKHFYESLVKLCQEKLGTRQTPAAPVAPRRMNDIQARAFENDITPFGAYKGQKIGTLSCDYIQWLSEPNEFTKQVAAYVNSERYKQRRRNET